MKKLACAIALLLPVALLATGCQKATTSPAEKEFGVAGKVVAIDRAQGTVTLDHEDIPGLMQAMQMEFKVAEPALLDGLSPGDDVQGQLRVQDSGQVISALEKR